MVKGADESFCERLVWREQVHKHKALELLMASGCSFKM